MAHSRVQYIAISRKVKNSALRYFYLNAEKNVFNYSRVYAHAANSLIVFISLRPLIPVQLNRAR